MTEAEHVAKAMADAVAMNYDHNAAIFDLYARAAITSLDAFRFAEKRRNCKHSNTIGSGGTGNAVIRWNCLDCGASYDSSASVGIAPDTK